MTRDIARTTLMVIGAWYAAVYLSFLITLALIPINNRLVYDGDVGTLIMHVWLAIPLAAMAGIAAMVLLRISEVQRSALLIVVLTCLFLYSGSSRNMRQWLTAKESIDRVGVVVEAVMPAAVCLLVGLYESRWRKGSSPA